MADGSAAATIDPNLSAAYDLRGMAVRERGDPRKALEENALAMPDFTQVIAFQPRLAQGYYAWADAERAAGDLAWKRTICGHESWMDAKLEHS